MLSLLKAIESKLYKRFDDSQINLFLCGSSTSDKESLRQIIADGLKNLPKVNIVYPEWIFANLMRAKTHDLLSLEHDLAKNVDLIVLPLEGPGSICELGAFASVKELLPRLIILNEEKHRRQHSFINDGPIRTIRNAAGSNHIIYYDSANKKEAAKATINKIVYFPKERVDSSIINLFNFSRYLGLVIAFFQPISKSKLEKCIFEWNSDIPRRFFDPAVELLVSKHHIRIKTVTTDEELLLSSEGHKFYIETLLKGIGAVRWFSTTRAKSVLRNKKAQKFNLMGAESKFLA